MDGSAPSVPIITLSAISSFTNLLKNLPLPTSVLQVSQDSLLYNGSLANEAQKILNSPNHNQTLVQELIQSLRLSTTDHIISECPNETPPSELLNNVNAPDLLKFLVLNDSNVFKYKPTYNNNTGFAAKDANNMYNNNNNSNNNNVSTTNINGPCASYEHQQLPFNDQDYEFLMNRLSPNFDQPIGTNEMMMEEAFPSNVQFVGQSMSNMSSNVPGRSTCDDGFNMAGVHKTAPGGVKPFVDNSPAQASSAPPTGAEPVVRMVNNNLNNNNNAHNNNALITNTMIPMYDPSNITNLQYSATQTTTSFQNYNNFYQQQLPMGNFPNPAYLHQSQQHMQPQQQQHLQQHTQQQHMLPHQQAHQQMLQQHMNPFEIVQQQPQQQQHHPQQHHLQQQQQFLRGPIKTSDSKVSTGDRLPRVSLTRLEDDINNGSNNNNISTNSSSQQYDVVNQHSSQQLKIKLSKRGLKRRTSDEDDESSYSSEFAPSLSERVKRRRNAKSVGVKYDVDDVEEEEEKDEEEDDSRDAKNRNVMSLLDPSFEDVDDRHRRREERKKKKHHYHHHSSKHRTFIDDDDQTDGPSCRRFYSLIDQVLELSEEIDLAAFKDNEEDEETSCLTDPVVPKNVLVDVVSEAAKLKTVGLMNQIHYDKLIKLMTILQYSIKQGLRSVPITELDDEDEDLRFRELTLNFVNIGLDACMIAMIILTSPNMPKQVFIEDVIEKVVRFSRQHMKNFIFPSFDPIYKADLSGKGMQASIKSKRSKNSGGSRDRLVISIYNKLTDLVGLLAELVDIQELTDTIILQTSSLSVAPFFVENIPELQLNALKLVTNIFSKYDKHRQLILEDILSSLARLPSNKKNMRSYRLNVDEQIQMVTALALQLIQCVVKLPSKQEHDDNNSNTNSNHNNNTNNNDDDDDNPANFDGEDVGKNRSAEKMTKNRNKIKFNMDKEAMILTSYDTAMFTAHNFLHVFLGKCTAKEEDDYRSMFGNFVNDLLSTVNKPQWPASELLLSILGSLLVKQFSSKSVEMSLRVASLDYLGIVAARLRKDAVSSHLNESVIDDIIKKVSKKDDDEIEDVDKPDVKEEVKQLDGDDAVVDGAIKEKKFNTNICDISRTQLLQKGLLDYLASTTETDHALIFARKFYIAQWLRDCSKEIETKTKKMAEEKMNVKKQRKPKKSAPKSRRHREKPAKHNRSKRRRAIVDDDENEEEEATDNDDTEEEEDEEDDDGGAQDNKESVELDILRLTQMEIEKRKNFLFDEISEMHVYKSSIKRNRSRLDYDGALLVTRYLASNRPFSQSFDIYLNKILKVLHESTVAVRSRALKCLAAVIEADPGVLARKDMQIGVHNRFTDSSTSVREAAIDLVGKFILVRPELTAQYYDMLSERILDTGISVRKRVIKIFRDICLEQPKFPKIPEMCVKMVRRVNDEEGIRKLVNETFQSMWFTPCTDKDSSVLVQKVYNITDVVAVASLNIGFEWLEQLLDNLLKKEEETKEKPVEKACTQIVDCLVDNVLQLEQREAELNRYISNATLPGSATTTAAATTTTTTTPPSRFSSCFSTLFLFCKVKPSLLVKHCIVIHPYLNIKSFNSSDTLIVSNVLKILELSLPLMEHPGEMFLAKVEEDISKLVLRHGPMIIQSCIGCLSAVVHDITHNFKLVHDCFDKFFGVIQKIRDVQFNTLTSTPLSTLDSMKVSLRRSLYVVGLLCKHFDFDSKEFDSYRKVSNVEAKVFEIFLHFLDFPDDSVRLQSLTAIGSLVSQHYELMLGKELRDMYHHMLTDPSAPSNMCSQVLCNIKDYLAEEEVKMAKADAEWRKLHDKENLKEMGDVQSGMASTIIQVYLKQILESFFHLDQQVRMSALEVVVLILNQGLVHPQQCMAHLISMGSDANVNIRLKADKQIQDIDKKYPGFVQAKAMQGIKMSCRLQKLLYGADSQQHNAGNQQQQQQPGQLRGVRMEEDGTMTSLNSFVYSVVRGNRSNRRVLVMNALRMFEDKTPLDELLYMADNLAYFSYQLQDEPLFIMHQIDIILSVSGFNLIQSFREVFYPALQQQQQSQLQQQQHQVQTTSQHVFDSCSTLATTTASEATTTLSSTTTTTTTWTPYVVATTSVNDCQRWSRMPCDDIHGNCGDVVAAVGGHHNQDCNLNTSAADHPKDTTVNSDDCYISRTSYSNDRDINSTDNFCSNNNEDSKNNNNNNNDNNNNSSNNNNNNNEEYELMTSMTNTQQALINRRKFEDDDDDDDDLETLLELVPSEGTSLVDLYMSLQGYLLLLVLKQHLKEMYGFTDNKIQRYSPTDVKLYEKAVNRKHGVKFHPKQALDVLGRSGQMSQMLDEDRREIVAAYINFKELMASIDKDDLDDNEATAGTTTTTSTSRAATSSGNPGNLDGTTTTNNNNNTFVQPSSNGQMMKPLTTTPRKANHSSNSYGSNINSSSGGSSSSKAASRKSRNPSNTSRSSSSLSSSVKKNKSKKKKSKRKRISYNSDSEEEEEEDDEEEEEDGDDWN